MTRTHTLFALAALDLAAHRPAAAQDAYFPANATINYAISGRAYVGVDSAFRSADPATGQPYNPTVNVLSGAALGDDLDARNRSTVNVRGGAITGHLFANNAAIVTVTGGTLGGLDAFDDSAVTVAGGTLGELSAYFNSVVTVTGGSVDGGLTAGDDSTVSVQGGTFGGGLAATWRSAVTVAAGTFGGGLSASRNSAVTITGGTFGNVGGVNFLDNTVGAFTFVGTGLRSTFLGPDATLSGFDYRLSGFLQDGHSVTGQIINVASGASKFTLVNTPEPSSFAALGLGVLGLGVLALKARSRAA